MPAAAIEQAAPISPWQPTSAPLIDASSLITTPIAPAVEQEADDALVAGAVHEAAVVHHHGWRHAGRTIGGGRDHPSAAGVLLVHGERVEREPVHAAQRVGAVGLHLQPVQQLGCPPAHLQPARQDAFGSHAVVHAVLHDRPDVQQLCVDLRVAAPDPLVLPHQPGNGEPGRRAVREQLRAGAERERQHGGVRLHAVRPGLRLVEDEAATHRVVGALAQLDAVGVTGREDHAVGVHRQRRAPVQHHVGVGVEVDVVVTGQRQPVARLHCVHKGTDGRRVDQVRLVAGKAEDDGWDAAVSVAGGAERAEQLHLHRCHACQHVGVGERCDEAAGGLHRPDGVGGGGSDPDPEEIKDAQRHDSTLPFQCVCKDWA